MFTTKLKDQFSESLLNTVRDVMEGKETVSLKNHPLEKMREYTDKEFPWEYREYDKYARSEFPKAFDSQEHFKKKYDAAPVKHLSHDELRNLDYSTVGSYMNNRSSPEEKERRHRETTNRPKNIDNIYNDLHNGKTAHPIVLKHSKGMRLLGGNNRLIAGAVHNKNIPVKVIDISDRH